MRTTCLAISIAMFACTPADNSTDEGGDTDPPPYTPPGTPAAEAKVYAHSDGALYKIDPDTLDVMFIGEFVWPAEVIYDSMTDIAIDANGNMVGISFDKVYSVNPMTAQATQLSVLDRSFNGMSFVSTSQLDDGAEVLVAAALDGSFYRLDPISGQSTPIGNYGSDMTSSGDIVSVTGFGTVATAVKPGSETDWLVRVDPVTGAATPIGDTGVYGIWGLGFWGTEIYGFTSENKFVLIDRDTGHATEIEAGPTSWWGAGVTTEAPVID
jgi:large repetitive protein